MTNRCDIQSYPRSREGFNLTPSGNDEDASAFLVESVNDAYRLSH